jgi:hypothetical protein
MGRVIKLTESDLRRIVKRVMNETMLYENIEVIDKILDKVGESGIESLSKSEKDILDKYSEWIKAGNAPVEFTWDEDESEEAFDVKYSDDDYQLEYKFKCGETLSDGSNIVFLTNEKPRMFSDGDIHIVGQIKLDGVDYIGVFTIADNGKIKNINFALNDDDFDSDDFTIEFEQDSLTHKMNEKGLSNELVTFLKKCGNKLLK